MDKDLVLYVLCVIGAIIVSVIMVVACSYQEMKTFNKFSNTKATLSDAVFSQLRVIAD